MIKYVENVFDKMLEIFWVPLIPLLTTTAGVVVTISKYISDNKLITKKENGKNVEDENQLKMDLVYRGIVGASGGFVVGCLLDIGLLYANRC